MADMGAKALLEWQALQHAPYPLWRTRPRQVGDPVMQDDLDWVATYTEWYEGTRLRAMRGIDPNPVQRIQELEEENSKLRQLISSQRAEEILEILNQMPFMAADVDTTPQRQRGH